MNENLSKGNSTVKMKNPVWKIKVGVFSPDLINREKKETEKKLWETKIVLN